MRKRWTLPVLGLCVAAAADPTAGFRQRFAAAGRLDVLSATVDDGSATAGPVRTTLRCRLVGAGTYRFAFDPYGPDARGQVLTVAWPPPSVSPHASVLPGGIHGGPPRATNGDRGPTLVRDAADPAVVTVRWVYGELPGRGRYGVQLARVEVPDPPATAP